MNEYFRLASFDAAGAFVGEDDQVHDDNGNRIQNGEHRLFFDLFDRLVRVERVSDGQTIGTYRYDAAGRRVHKEFLNPASGAQEEVFFVSDGAREIEELDGAGNVVADYVFGSLYVDQVVQMRRGGQDYYLHSNSLFSVSAVTDAAGSVVERYTYGSVYGTVTATDDAGGALSAAAEVGNPWRFTGRRLDPESGLYHYRLRYYDPAQGRFVSRDPLGMWGDPGQRGVEQGYCGGNPVNRVDPYGLQEGWGIHDDWSQAPPPTLTEEHMPFEWAGTHGSTKIDKRRVAEVFDLALEHIESNPKLQQYINKVLAEDQASTAAGCPMTWETWISTVRIPIFIHADKWDTGWPGQTNYGDIYDGKSTIAPDKSISLVGGLFDDDFFDTVEQDKREAAEVLLHEMIHFLVAQKLDKATSAAFDAFYAGLTSDTDRSRYYDEGAYVELDLLDWSWRDKQLETKARLKRLRLACEAKGVSPRPYAE